MNYQWVAENFSKVQYLLIGLIVFAAWSGIRSRQEKTHFKSREADRPDLDQILKKGEKFENAKTNRKPVLELPGIRLSGEPHEILGIAANATSTEIMRAYKDKIKLFHPDRIQGQARDQLKFYEDASAKLNQAKEDMLKRK